MRANPPIDLREESYVGIFNWYTEEGALLAVAVDTMWAPGEGTQLLGMVLTRSPELEDLGGVPFALYQVIRSAVRTGNRGLGPRLYQYAMLVVSLDEPTGFLAPDTQLSPDAKRIWEAFYREGWALHDDREIGDNVYGYAGTQSTTDQLQLAERRGQKWLERLVAMLDDDPDEVERFLMPRALAVFGSRMTPNPKVVRGRKYVHHDALGDLEAAERRAVKAAHKAAGVSHWDVARVDPDGSVMLGATTTWDRSNPELQESWLVRPSGKVSHRTYRGKRPKYHKTALMLPDYLSNGGVGEGGTAIARGGPSAPVRYLDGDGLIRGPVLDFGAGRGEDARWLRKKGYRVDEYDPNFDGVDRLPAGKYSTVLCIYVLNVLPKSEEGKLLRQIRSKVRPGGEAFVAVRADVDRAGKTSRGYQRPVKLSAGELLEGTPSGAHIYALQKR